MVRVGEARQHVLLQVYAEWKREMIKKVDVLKMGWKRLKVC